MEHGRGFDTHEKNLIEIDLDLKTEINPNKAIPKINNNLKNQCIENILIQEKIDIICKNCSSALTIPTSVAKDETNIRCPNCKKVFLYEFSKNDPDLDIHGYKKDKLPIIKSTSNLEPLSYEKIYGLSSPSESSKDVWQIIGIVFLVIFLIISIQ